MDEIRRLVETEDGPKPKAVRDAGPRSTKESEEKADARMPAVIDGKTLSVLPTPPRIDLSNVRDVRREMSAVYRAMKEGKMDDAQGTKLVYVLREVGALIKAQEIEQRIEALERAINFRGKTK